MARAEEKNHMAIASLDLDSISLIRFIVTRYAIAMKKVMQQVFGLDINKKLFMDNNIRLGLIFSIAFIYVYIDI